MNVGVFFGGKSPEHDVSIITGELVMSELKKMGVAFVPVYISKEGEWYAGEQLGELKFFRGDDIGEALKIFEQSSLNIKESISSLVLERKGSFSKVRNVIDLAFPCFHGSNGEDGTIQGLFEMFNVPYVGCEVAASALAFDKILTKLFYVSLNIPTTKFAYYDKSDWLANKNNIISEIKASLRYPIFVKPPKLGSSIGITRAKDDRELELGIEVALHYGERFLVEEGVENLMDVTCWYIRYIRLR